MKSVAIEGYKLASHAGYKVQKQQLLMIIGVSLSEPHINVKFVRFVCLSVCLSFCPYVHDTKIYKSNTNLRHNLCLRVPSVVDCSA